MLFPILMLSLLSGCLAQCRSGFVYFEQSCYFFIRTELTWWDADQQCTGLIPRTYECHLTAIETQREQEFLTSYLRNSADMRDRDAWTSMTRIDRNRNWIWAATYEQPRYLNWAPGQPSGEGRCVQMWRRYGFAWDDVYCTDRKGAVCEYRLSNPPPPASCPEGFTRFGSSCYYFVPTSLNWHEAEQYCTYFRPRTYDVHLVSIETAEEQNFLVNIIRNTNDLRTRNFWTSGNQLDSRRPWIWARTDQALGYFSWAPGEPDGGGRCIQLWSEENWNWDDIVCRERTSGFICEVAA